MSRRDDRRDEEGVAGIVGSTRHEDVARVLAPEVIVTPAATHTAMCVLVGKDGRVRGLAPHAAVEALGVPIDSLPRRVLLPGFVNAHSHVFQRLLRGRTQRGFAGRDSFWTWREQMYAEADRLTPDSLYAVALSCYGEMLAAGYTTVGEFHYVHHAPDGRPYDNPLAMAQALLAAAAECGIRLVLLPVAYARAGFERPPEPAQRRFCFPQVEQYLRFVDDLRASIADPRQSVGVAPHSVRAVPAEWLDEIARYARDHGLVLHVHASEQVAEVEDTQSHHGCTPIALLAAHGAMGERTTLVHATHATDGDCDAIVRAGSCVCVCPTTEGDLGDGIAPYASFAARRIPLAIGSDSNTRIDPLEELRWAEYSARMRYQYRRVLAVDQESPSERLLAAGTAGGARSLGVDAGLLESGEWADALAVDLDHPALRGVAPDDLRDALIFGADAGVVTDIWVAGRRLRRVPSLA